LAALELDPATVDWREGRAAATGDIHLAIDGVPFPHPEWNDFIVVVACAFAQSCVRLLRAESDAETVHFMEGPHAVLFRRSSETSWQLRTETRSSAGDRHGPWLTIDVNRFVDSVRNATQSLVSASPAGAERSRDDQELAEALGALLSTLGGGGTLRA
jgi:hypothetical protein